MFHHEQSVSEKIEALIHKLLYRLGSATARDALSLASAVKELYLCLDSAQSGAEQDWMSKLQAAILEEENQENQ